MAVTGKAQLRDPFAGMNKTEERRAVELEALKRAGRIHDWAFEAEALRLADGAWYTPDFRVVHLDGAIEFEEIKGHWREAARVRIKVAAERHPYRFTALQPVKGGLGWTRESFGPPAAAEAAPAPRTVRIPNRRNAPRDALDVAGGEVEILEQRRAPR